MKKAFLVLALLAAGCATTPVKYHAQGRVQYVQFDGYHCSWTVVFEGENGSIFTIKSYSCTMPPVWQGLHAEIEYESDTDMVGYYKNLTVVRRLP